MLHSLRCALVAPLAATGLAVLLVSASPAAAGTDCASFAGLSHCALGSATLTAADAGLQVSGVGSAGADGVKVTLDDAVDWQAGVHFASGDSSPCVTLGAEAGGEEISRAEVAVSDSEIHLSATFTGADGPGTYSILVYRGGTLVGSQGGVEAERWVTFNEDEDLFMELIAAWTFRNGTTDGACSWIVGFAETVRLALPGGVKLEGDEVRLVEEVAAAGHYPYVAFDGITLRSSRDLEIISEETH